MISLQHVLALTSPPLSSPPLAVSSKSSRSTTPLAGTIIYGPQEQSLQPSAHPEAEHEDEPKMEPLQEIGLERPSQVAPEPESSNDRPASPDGSRYATLTISDTANLFRERGYQRERCHKLSIRLQSAQRSTALTPRLLRTGEYARKALVEHFKQGDKNNFVSVYVAIHDLREACKTTWRASDSQEGSGLVSTGLEEPIFNFPSNFIDHLSSSSRGDILELLHLVRTSPEFLADRIGSLSPPQLLALTSSIHHFNVSESVLPVPSRGRSQTSAMKRGLALNTGFLDRILDFERTDPLSILIFNVFDLSQGPESPDSRLRLDVWSSTCARLINGSGTMYYRLISDFIFAWTANREWSVKQRLELYLMDILEKGAFLLEDPFGGSSRPPTIDPLSTEVAEEFFEQSVQDLFEVLDESNGGIPLGALELCTFILSHLEDHGTRDRFREFFFLQWYFSKYLPKALIYPEEEGMLLGFHVKKEARQLLHKVASRAQTQAFGFFNSLPNTSTMSEKTRDHLHNMFTQTSILPTKHTNQIPPPVPAKRKDLDSSVISLSTMDIYHLISALVPRVERPSFSWEQQSAISASSSLKSVPFRSEQAESPSRPRSVFDSSHLGNLEGQDLRPSETSSIFSGPMLQNWSKESQGNSSFQFFNLCKGLEHARGELSNLLSVKFQNNRHHPCADDWILFSIQRDEGKSGIRYQTEAPDSSAVLVPHDRIETENLPEYGYNSQRDRQDRKRLEDAIVKLIDETAELEENRAVRPLDDSQMMTLDSLDAMFKQAIEYCKSQSDYVKAHHWWDARQLLHRLDASGASNCRNMDVLHSLLQVSQDSIEASLKTIKSCERTLSRTQRSLQRFDKILKSTFDSLAKLRDKMWYMTDVKHSSRYEEAKNVALALKTMGYPATVRRNYSNPPSKFRSHPGSSTGSFLQNPEMQTMNIMKTSTDQGGPNKLADEQVDMTRKWLNRYGIENFCKGEERIHRFCLEIKTSVSRIVGETMTDGPVLWASDLYQLERTLYDSQMTRPSSVRNGVRPSSITSEEGLFAVPPGGPGIRGTESYFRMGYEPFNTPSHKLSSPSLVSERWRVARDKENFDTGSLDDSPGKAVSTSTVESYNTFWSPQPPKIRSSTSVSSFRSRPSSIYNESLGLKAADRLSGAKKTFLDDLRQTLTSLLLSDLGSPVWSTGSETDAWFSKFSPMLAQERARHQAQEDERTNEVAVPRGSTKSLNDLSKIDADHTSQPQARQRSKSAQPSQTPWTSPASQETPSLPIETEAATPHLEPPIPGFSYRDAFCRLLEKFSRHSNPFTKLNALHELRLLALASLSEEATGDSLSHRETRGGSANVVNLQQSPHTPESQIGDVFGNQASSKPSFIHPPLFPPFESPSWTPADGSLDRSTSPNAVINLLQDLLREGAPKTLFRDLQFIAAFVDSDTLNKTESGKAFLDAGIAALGLKEDVCQTMVEIADRIVSQEINRRSPISDAASKKDYSMADAAKLWIITAKEGNAVAQRELAILYLTHPELLTRVTLPMTMPRETFRAEMMYRRNEDMNRSDPNTMCLALHWMQHSANGGDELAKNNLREREEFDSFP